MMKKLIDKQAAIDIVNFECGEWQGLASTIVKELNKLPSVEPEREKGRWLEFTNTNHTYVCSVCGRMLVNITDGKNTVTKNYPFCHCGADMRGEKALKQSEQKMIDVDIIKQKRPVGKWINKTNNPNYSPFDNSGAYLYTCSTCGWVTSSAKIDDCCPKCGSKNEINQEDNKDE